MKKFLFGVFQFILCAYILSGNDAFGATYSETNQHLQQTTADQNSVASTHEFGLFTEIQTLPEHHQTTDEVVFEDLQEEEEEDSSKKPIKSLFYEQIQFYFSFYPNRFQENKKFIFAVLPKHDSISTSRTILFQIFLI